MPHHMSVHARSWSIVLERSLPVDSWGPWRCYCFRGWMLAIRIGFDRGFNDA